MEKLRFKDSFDYRIIFTTPSMIANVFVPPLLLQPFAENAIWHGLMHKEGQGNLTIELNVDEKILTCVITDNGIGRNKAAQIKSKSVRKAKINGLENYERTPCTTITRIMMKKLFSRLKM